MQTHAVVVVPRAVGGGELHGDELRRPRGEFSRFGVGAFVFSVFDFERIRRRRNDDYPVRPVANVRYLERLRVPPPNSEAPEVNHVRRDRERPALVLTRGIF